MTEKTFLIAFGYGSEARQSCSYHPNYGQRIIEGLQRKEYKGLFHAYKKTFEVFN